MWVMYRKLPMYVMVLMGGIGVLGCSSGMVGMLLIVLYMLLGVL